MSKSKGLRRASGLGLQNPEEQSLYYLTKEAPGNGRGPGQEYRGFRMDLGQDRVIISCGAAAAATVRAQHLSSLSL